jgi:hypothetical protein
MSNDFGGNQCRRRNSGLLITLFRDGFVALFLLCRASHALCGIRNGVQAGFGDIHAALLASAIVAVFDPLDCGINLIKGLFITSEKIKGEFLFGVVAP